MERIFNLLMSIPLTSVSTPFAINPTVAQVATSGATENVNDLNWALAAGGY